MGPSQISPPIAGHVPAHAEALFRRSTADEVMQCVNRMWDMSGLLPFPLPDRLHCGWCGSKDLLMRYWKFHAYPEGADKVIRWRCDVSLKCRVCSNVGIFGVATPREMNEYWGYHTEVSAHEAVAGLVPEDQVAEAKHLALRQLVGLDQL